MINMKNMKFCRDSVLVYFTLLQWRSPELLRTDLMDTYGRFKVRLYDEGWPFGKSLLNSTGKLTHTHRVPPTELPTLMFLKNTDTNRLCTSSCLAQYDQQQTVKHTCDITYPPEEDQVLSHIVWLDKVYSPTREIAHTGDRGKKWHHESLFKRRGRGSMFSHITEGSMWESRHSEEWLAYLYWCQAVDFFYERYKRFPKRTKKINWNTGFHTIEAVVVD
jgi:hypothetical protein